MLYHTKNPHGGDCYASPVRLDFSANTNPFGTPEAVLQAVRDSLGALHRYPDPGCRALVRAIAEQEHTDADFILCGNGAAELIFSYCAALRPRRVLEPAPTFSEYSRAASQFGAEILRCALSAENGFLPGEDLLRRIEAERPDAVFLCNPNNPSGRLMPEGLLNAVLAQTKQLDIRLFLDECFLDLSEGGVSLVPMLRKYPNLIILKAFTKSYGMAGLRLGYCLSADRDLLERMSRTVQPWNVSTPAQAAGIAALGEAEFLEKTRALIRTERPRLARALTEMGFAVCPSDTNFLLFSGPAGLDTALRRREIAIRSCANYPGLGPGWYRIAVRLPEENEELLRAIRACREELSWQKTS